MNDRTDYKLEVVAPVFPVADVKRALSYYTEKLSFAVGFEWADGDGQPLSYAILQHGDTELHLTLAKEPHKTVAYFFVSNMQGFYEAVRSSGADIAHEIEDQPWQMREFEVTDPDGNRVVFGEHLSRISGGLEK